jgi:hypothetical protein
MRNPPLPGLSHRPQMMMMMQWQFFDHWFSMPFVMTSDNHFDSGLRG